MGSSGILSLLYKVRKGSIGKYLFYVRCGWEVRGILFLLCTLYSMVWMVRGIILKNKLFSFKEDADEKYELFPNWNWNQQNWETRG